MVKIADPQMVEKKAGDLYRCGDFFCSEAVVKTIRDEFELPLPDDVLAMASGFPVGIGGAGCTCGAISGGVLALGMVFGRKTAGDPSVNKIMALAKELHDNFKSRHKSTCCRVLTKGMEKGSQEHMNQCVAFTGEVAAETAKIILRERNNH
jgi:C_GCAxxG_C_C family probable redox protein